MTRYVFLTVSWGFSCDLHQLLSAQTMGDARTVLVTKDVHQNMSAERRVLFHQIIPVDTLTFDVLDKVVATQVAEDSDTRLLSHDDALGDVIGRLNDKYGLKGYSRASIQPFFDKDECKKRLGRNGVRVPRHVAFEGRAHGPDLKKYLAWIEGQIGFPMFAKPIVASGAANCALLRTQEDLRLWAKQPSHASGYEIEEFIADAVLYHCDSLLVDGQAVFTQVSRYSRPCFDFGRGHMVGSWSLPASSPVTRRLRQFASDVVDALHAEHPVPNGVTHMEAFLTETGEPVFVETQFRPPGANAKRSLGLTLGVNLEMLHLTAQIGQTIPIPAQVGPYAAWLYFPSQDGRIERTRPLPALSSRVIENTLPFSPGDTTKRATSIFQAMSSRHVAQSLVLVNNSFEALEADIDILSYHQPYQMTHLARPKRVWPGFLSKILGLRPEPERQSPPSEPEETIDPPKPGQHPCPVFYPDQGWSYCGERKWSNDYLPEFFIHIPQALVGCQTRDVTIHMIVDVETGGNPLVKVSLYLNRIPMISRLFTTSARHELTFSAPSKELGAQNRLAIELGPQAGVRVAIRSVHASTSARPFRQKLLRVKDGRASVEKVVPDNTATGLARAEKLIRQALKRKDPFSLVRMGDGEGRIISNGSFSPIEIFGQCIRYQWREDVLAHIWQSTGPSAFTDVLTFLRDEITQAVASADILCAPTAAVIPQKARTVANLMAQTAYTESCAFCLTHGRGKPCFELFLFHKLHVSGAMERILSGLPAVTLITHTDCRDAVARRFGISDVQLIRIPGHYSFMPSQERHFPDAYHGIVQSLSVPEKGHLFLVGAGYLGKSYCRIIKERGGIALDIGSLFDGWTQAGRTRVVNKKALALEQYGD